MDDHVPGQVYRERDSVMAGRILYFPSPVTFTRSGGAAQVCVILNASAGEELSSSCEREMPSTASQAGLGCVRGTTLALAFEAATAVVIYTVWQWFHMLR